MSNKFVSFRPDDDTLRILDDLPYGERSTFIKKAIKEHAYLVLDDEKKGFSEPEGSSSLEEVKEIEDQELHPQAAPPLEEQVGHPLNGRSAEGLEESPEDLGSLSESGSSLKQSEPTDTSDSLTPLLTLLSHRLTESLKEE